MNRQQVSKLLGLLGLLVFASIAEPGRWASAKRAPDRSRPQPLVTFNQSFLEGLQARSDPTDPDVVFQTVFSALESDVMVYPTENYYYFTIHTDGKTISGNLRLDAGDRHRGILHLGYFEYDESGTYQDYQGRHKALSAADGVKVECLAPFAYSVTYRGKTVIFHLNDVGMVPPPQDRLREKEEFIGPVFDESGLRFSLLFSQTERHFLYILDEQQNVPETLVDIGEGVLLGSRTGFAFFDDTANQRKILIGVNGWNTERNNWYDGPFDQLPDNYVEQTEIRKYLESAYPYTRGLINQFGGYLEQEDARVAIFSYAIFYEVDEIIDLVNACGGPDPDPDRFYACITPDPGQSFQPEPVLPAAESEQDVDSSS